MKLTVVIIDHMAVFRQALDAIVQAYGSPEQIIGFPDTATLLHAEDLACDLLLWGNTASHPGRANDKHINLDQALEVVRSVSACYGTLQTYIGQYYMLHPEERTVQETVENWQCIIEKIELRGGPENFDFEVLDNLVINNMFSGENCGAPLE